MSFPSALPELQRMGVTPETASPEQAERALLAAMQADTSDGFAYVQGLVQAYRDKVRNPLVSVRNGLDPALQGDVLRAEWLPKGGLKMDVRPDGKLGRQVSRLLGTDAARSALERHFGACFALANCCGAVVGADKKQVAFTAAQQIAWQTAIDC